MEAPLALLRAVHVGLCVNNGVRRKRVWRHNQKELTHTINPSHGGYTSADFVRDLLNPRKLPVEFVNLVPFSRIETGYTPTNWRPAQRLVCLGEIRSAYHEAIEGAKPSEIRKALAAASKEVLSNPVEAFQYFLEVHDSYRIARDLMMKATTPRPRKSAPTTPDERRIKRADRLDTFGTMVWKTVEAELALMPPAARPRIIVPKCLAGVVAP
ncbi:MAG: hypothetical protein PHW63_01215 [Alphaproteobacteria bacterium]|nr:hypothetical protein [Alphaproteobacteria bacterium]